MTRGHGAESAAPACPRRGQGRSPARAPASPGRPPAFQIVLLKDQKKCFSIDSPGYEPEAVAVHPSGDMVAVGGTVRPFFPTPSLPGARGIWG